MALAVIYRTLKLNRLNEIEERIMALPKYKTSRANTHSRRANWKASAVQTVTCPNCGSQAFPHMACPSCGTFRGRVYREAIRSEHTK